MTAALQAVPASSQHMGLATVYLDESPRRLPVGEWSGHALRSALAIPEAFDLERIEGIARICVTNSATVSLVEGMQFVSFLRRGD